MRVYVHMYVHVWERERESAPAVDQATNHVEKRFNDADVHPHWRKIVKADRNKKSM